jgi:hypothetical protein
MDAQGMQNILDGLHQYGCTENIKIILNNEKRKSDGYERELSDIHMY